MVALSGTSAQGFEWRVDCDAVQTTASATLPSGSHTFSHRVRRPTPAIGRRGSTDTVKVDTDLPVNSTTVPSGLARGPVTVPLNVADSDLAGARRVEGRTPPTRTPSSNTATVNGTGTHTLYTSAVDAAGNRHDRSQPCGGQHQPGDDTVVDAGWY